MSTSASITLDSRIQRAPNQTSGEIDGKVVLFSVTNGNYFHINEVGSRIWELIETPIAVREIVTRLRSEFDVTIQQCEDEVIRFIAQLEHEQLVVPAP